MLFSKPLTLGLTVFFCGAVVMMFELVGSRILAPTVGTSLYAWTSLIGVVLASLSLGYFLGGSLADDVPSTRPLAVVLVLSAVAIALSACGKDIASALVAGSGAPLEIQAVMLALMLFAPASVLLGMVSPFAVRLSIADVDSSGKVSGRLYALSTAGSIFGTFFAGFYLIPRIGSLETLLIFSGMLLALAGMLVWGEKMKTVVGIGVFATATFFIPASALSAFRQQSVVADIDTAYQRVVLVEVEDPETGNPILALTTDPYGIQAGMFTDGTEDLVFAYSRFYRLFRHIVPSAKHALMIGGAAYTYPRDFLRTVPDGTMDVVEIDPGMTEIARKYFGLADDPQLSIIHEDARTYLNRNTEKYDVIFGDAFNAASSVPFQLTTIEAVQKEHDALNNGGAVIVNLISAIEGEQGKFARAEYATYVAVFPQVYLFAVQNPEDGSTKQNVMLVALKSDVPPTWESADPVLQELFSHRWTAPIAADVPVLTDNFAPVEYYKRTSL
jgi:spermidine synthase